MRVVKIFHITAKHVIGKKLLEMVLFWGSFWNTLHFLFVIHLRNSMNERTHFFIKYISHTLFSKGSIFLWCVRNGWRDIYSVRGLLPISSSRSQGVPTLAHPCKLVRDDSDRLRVPRSTAILSTLSKSDRVVLITWSPSGYTPVVPECPDRAAIY